MKKYLTFIKNGAQGMMAYRFNFFSWFFVESINILVACYIWLSVYKQGNSVGLYSLRDLISYFVLSRIIAMAVSDRGTSDAIQTDVSQGRLTNYLLKPIYYPLSLYARGIGETLASIVMTLPAALVFLFFLSDTINPAFERAIFFFVSLGLSSVIGFCIWLIIGLLTLFMENIFGLQFMLWLALSVFSGRTAPLDIMPSAIKTLADLMPFKYLIYVPLQIINGSADIISIKYSLMLGCLWLVALIIISQFTYYLGLKKYEGQGT